jgi:hypothetical protein
MTSGGASSVKKSRLAPARESARLPQRWLARSRSTAAPIRAGTRRPRLDRDESVSRRTATAATKRPAACPATSTATCTTSRCKACRPSAIYRLRKYARRNKVALAFATLLMAGLGTAMRRSRASEMQKRWPPPGLWPFPTCFKRSLGRPSLGDQGSQFTVRELLTIQIAAALRGSR